MIMLYKLIILESRGLANGMWIVMIFCAASFTNDALFLRRSFIIFIYIFKMKMNGMVRGTAKWWCFVFISWRRLSFFSDHRPNSQIAKIANRPPNHQNNDQHVTIRKRCFSHFRLSFLVRIFDAILIFICIELLPSSLRVGQAILPNSGQSYILNGCFWMHASYFQHFLFTAEWKLLRVWLLISVAISDRWNRYRNWKTTAA